VHIRLSGKDSQSLIRTIKKFSVQGGNKGNFLATQPVSKALFPVGFEINWAGIK
jgi:hypothetical protein